MPSVSVVHEDGVLAGGLRSAFEGAGFQLDGPPDLIVAGALDAASARASLAKLRGSTVPVLWIGDAVPREEAWASGVEVLPPWGIGDVVTFGRLVLGSKERTILTGQFDETLTVFRTVRALSAAGRSGVLTLHRGFRRGEIRFYRGEVTSAVIGGLHAQAAFHQLLLWTTARFEWRRELVVRRAQIPLPAEDVLAEAEKFTRAYESAAGGLSPSAVYLQDEARVVALTGELPTEVHAVLRLFDGRRTIADALEESPFRTFETLRIILHAVEVGLLTWISVSPPTEMSPSGQVERWLEQDAEKRLPDPAAVKPKRVARATNVFNDPSRRW